MISSLITALVWWPVITYVSGVIYILVESIFLWRRYWASDERVSIYVAIYVALFWPVLIPRFRNADD